jgi:DNA-binding LytR/AlgR family response regulator
MPMIAEFTLNDGNPVMINMDQIDYFQPSDDGTLVVFADGRQLELQESYDTVAEVLNPERQAGC